jgi:hypothetical protein
MPLLHFFVGRVLPARAAEFSSLQALGMLFLVLRGGVIPVLAVTTLQCNDFPHFLNSFSLECWPV